MNMVITMKNIKGKILDRKKNKTSGNDMKIEDYSRTRAMLKTF